MKPKVLIMIATDPIGGPGKGLFQFFKYAPREEFDYVLCNFDVKDHLFGQFIQEARRLGLNMLLLRQRLAIDPWLIPEARRIVVKHGINVIQTHSYKANVLGFCLRLLWGKPWIAFAHGYTHGGWKIRIYQLIDKIVLRYADRVIAVSESMKTLLVQLGVQEEKIRLIYNAIELPHQNPEGATVVRDRHGLAPDRKVIGVIGRLSPEKGLMDFLKALEQTITSMPNVVALLVGEGPDQAALEQFATSHGLGERVVFTGYQEKVADYYQALDLLVLPSLTEGLPNVVLEAMSFGVPVLATNVGGVSEIINADNGVLVPPGDPDTLAAKMVELLRDDVSRRIIGCRGRDSLFPRFAPDHRVRQILSVYNELLSAKS